MFQYVPICSNMFQYVPILATAGYLSVATNMLPTSIPQRVNHGDGLRRKGMTSHICNGFFLKKNFETTNQFSLIKNNPPRWWFKIHLSIYIYIDHFGAMCFEKIHPLISFSRAAQSSSTVFPPLPAVRRQASASWRKLHPICGAFHSHGDTPIAGWFAMEKPY